MSFFNENDIINIRTSLDNGKTQRDNEIRNKRLYAPTFANTMMETFLLFKEAAKEYPNLCRAIGAKPDTLRRDGYVFFWFVEVYQSLYDLSPVIYRDDFDNNYWGTKVGISKKGSLILVHTDATTNVIPERQLIPVFEEYFVLKYNNKSGLISFSDTSTPSLFELILSWSFSGSTDRYFDSDNDHIVSQYTYDPRSPKSENEVRESIKKFLLDKATERARKC